MANDLHEIDDWLQALLNRLEPAERQVVNRRVSYVLRRSQASRIAAQKNPDGTPYVPRKSQSKNLRKKKGTIKRKSMFAKLRTQRFLKVGSDANGMDVSFRGRAGMIAIVHQDGEKHTSSDGRTFVTPKRELLGLTDAEMEMLIDAYLTHMAGP